MLTMTGVNSLAKMVVLDFGRSPMEVEMSSSLASSSDEIREQL